MSREFRDSSKIKRPAFGKRAKKPGKKLSRSAIIAIIAFVVVLVAVAAAFLIPASIAHGEKIKEISVFQMPTKTTYFVGEEANYDGLRVLVTRNNGETFTVWASKCSFEGFRTDIAVESRIITVRYGGKTAMFSITVKEPPTVDPVLKSIRLDSLPKTQYKVGDVLDTSGAYLIREYMDGSTVKVNLLPTDIEQYEDWSTIRNTPGTHTLTVAYAENGVRVTTTYQITVAR